LFDGSPKAAEGVNVARAYYTYYGHRDTNGNVGDLRSAVVETWDEARRKWTSRRHSVQYYAYYKEALGSYSQGMLKAVVGPEAFFRMVKAGKNPLIAGPDPHFADVWVEYDKRRRIKKIALNGGSLTHTFEYFENVRSATGYDRRRFTTAETRNDGTTVRVHSNFLGQGLLRSLEGEGGKWTEWNKYDTLTGSLQAMFPPSTIGSVEFGDNGSLKVKTLDGNGPTIGFDYITVSSERTKPGPLNAVTIGLAAAYSQVGGRTERNCVELARYGYETRRVKLLDGTSNSIFAMGSLVVKQETTPGKVISAVTSYDNQWIEETAAIDKRATTLPVVSKELHGNGAVDKIEETFDRFGFLRKVVDERGASQQYEYVVDRSAVISKEVQGGDHLRSTVSFTEKYTYDNHGRITKLIGPATESIIDVKLGTGGSARQITVLAYLDDAGIAIEASGFSTGNNEQFASPMQVREYDRAGRLVKSGSIVKAADPRSVTAAECDRAIWCRKEELQIDEKGWLAAHRVYSDIAKGTFAETRFDPDVMRRPYRVFRPDGTVIETLFDVRGLAKSIQMGIGNATKSLVAEFSYDDEVTGRNGNLTRQVLHVGGGSPNRVTEMAYNWRNQLVHAQTESVEKALEYTNQGQVQKTGVKAAGLESSQLHYFDERGRVFQTEYVRRSYADPAQIDRSALYSRMWRDSTGNVVVHQPAGSIAYARTFFDGLNRPYLSAQAYHGLNGDISATDEAVLAVDRILEMAEITHDVVGNLRRQVIYAKRNQLIDEFGDIRNRGDVKRSVVDSWYDPLGRPMASATYGDISPPEPALAIPSSTDSVLANRVHYNDRGEPFAVVSPKGILTEAEFDDAGRPVATKEAGLRTTSTEYHPDGRVRQQIVGGTQAGDQVTQFKYATSDGAIDASLVTEVIQPDLNSVRAQNNLQGELASLTDANGTTHQYRYDEHGRLTDDSVTELGGNVDGAVRRMHWEYDGQGRLRSTSCLASADIPAQSSAAASGSLPASAPRSTVHREYTFFDQIEKESQQFGDGTKETVQYIYTNPPSHVERPVNSPSPPIDAAPAHPTNSVRLDRLIYPSQRQLQYMYEFTGEELAGNRLSRVQAIADFRPLSGINRRTSYRHWGASEVYGLNHHVRQGFGDPAVSVSYSLDGLGPLPEGVPFGALDRHSRLRELVWRGGAGQQRLEQTHYEYDRNGLPTRRNEERFEYTDLDQLKTLWTPGEAYKRWDSDSVGNWTMFTRAEDNDLVQRRRHGLDNRILGLQALEGPAWASVGYDRNGNTTRFPKPAAPQQALRAIYDAWNRLVAVQDGPTTYRYDYDALGRRIEKHRLAGGQVQESRRFLYSADWQVLEEHVRSTATGGIYKPACEYVWGVRGPDDLILRDRFDVAGSGGERLFTISDALGSVTGLLGTQPGTKGQVVTRFAYDPYGAHDQVGGEFGWNHLFAGYYFDRETGLYHVRRRFYHAGLGRWLQHDPLGDVDSPNLYEYCKSNPATFVDPTGEIIPLLLLIGAGAIVGAVHGGMETYAALGDEATASDYALGITLGGLFGGINPIGEFFSFGGALIGGSIEAAAGGKFYGTGFQAGGLIGGFAGGFGVAARQGLRRAAQQGIVFGSRRAMIGAGARSGLRGVAWEGAGILAGGGIGAAVTGDIRGAYHGATLGMFVGGISRSSMRRLQPFWEDIAGEWRGWGKGFADTGRFRWTGSRGMRAHYGRMPGVQPWDEIHHRILAQGGTRGGAGTLSFFGFIGEQYGRYIPNFIKNTRWNMRNMGQSLRRGGSGLHEALHGKNPAMRLNVLLRIWHGTNALDKVAILSAAAGTAYWLSD
jgi:RHS repeat-associated protein